MLAGHETRKIESEAICLTDDPLWINIYQWEIYFNSHVIGGW